MFEAEIMLRHLPIEDALLRLDRFLDESFKRRLRRVCVIHGKGGGDMRSAVQRYLSHHPLVRSYRAGISGEGGAGVTIAELLDQ